MLRIGAIIDNRYKILRIIGRGGTSCVYLAENIRLHNYWAIKEVYKTDLAGNGAFKNTLIAESNILTRLRHPGLPAIVDIMYTSQAFLIVMEYIQGVSLDKVLAEKGAQSEALVTKWAQQLCDVLEYLHSQRPPIIYRDMKPANIMLKPDGNVVLIDFGMAREFKDYSQHDTTNLGTHGYAAPEQYSGFRQTDARTDIYSLGVTLYHLVTGQDPCLPPYGLRPIRAVNSSLSYKLEQIIVKCTQLEPERRYQTVSSLKADLAPNSSAPQVPMGFEEPVKKNNFLWVIPVVVVLVLMIGVVAIVLGMQATGNGDAGSSAGNVGSYSPDIPDDAGLSFEQNVYISYADERRYYTFVPEKDGMYHIYSVCDDGLPIAWLVDEDDNTIDESNTDGMHFEIDMYSWLQAGETYCIETTLYDLDSDYPATGSYWLYVEYDEQQ